MQNQIDLHISVLTLADKYGLDELKRVCEVFLCEWVDDGHLWAKLMPIADLYGWDFDDLCKE